MSQENLMRFLFEYKILSTGSHSEFSVPAKSEEGARKKIVERVADMEFTEEEDVEILGLLKVLELKDHYYECEGCT